MRLILFTLGLFLSSCYGTYYISDAEYDDTREEHLAVTYHNNSIYWGWNSGNTCPPSYYNTTTHVIINRPVNRPTHRPNRPKVNTHRPNIRVKTNTHRNNKVIIKTNNGSKRTNKTTIRRKSKK